MSLTGQLCRLRAMEPSDVELMYGWENDTEIWSVSGTNAPFSRHILTKFIDQQSFDIFATRQMRLMIETADGETIGALDIFEYDPQNLRAGIGILIHDKRHRNEGYACDAINIVCQYAREVLHLHQLWCNIGADNVASLALFRKSGFTEVGVKKEWAHSNDGFKDELLFQKIL